MRKITITGGYSDYAVATLTETKAKPLNTSLIKMALVLSTISDEDAAFPDATDPAWRTPDLTPNYPKAGQARVSLLVNEQRYGVGSYYLWLLPVDNPTATPVKASNHLVVLV